MAPNHGFHIQIQIWGSSDWPDILGVGPRLTLLTRQFDISSSGKLPSPEQTTPGVWPFTAESSPAVLGFSEAPACRYRS